MLRWRLTVNPYKFMTTIRINSDAYCQLKAAWPSRIARRISYSARYTALHKGIFQSRQVGGLCSSTESPTPTDHHSVVMSFSCFGFSSIRKVFVSIEQSFVVHLPGNGVFTHYREGAGVLFLSNGGAFTQSLSSLTMVAT
jgi:hypothetical protein